jgi:hypothetical protein
MPLESHPVYGVLYVGVTSFKTQAKGLGCARALEFLGDAGDELTKAAIAMASRSVEAYCDVESFDPDHVFAEVHKFNLKRRRVTPNNPPVFDLQQFAVRTGPQSLTTFVLTPVANGPDGNPIAWGPVYYNPQQNYLELSGLSVAGNSTPLITLGLMEPQVEIKYRTCSLKPNIAAAAAYQAAHLINATYVANQAPGVSSLSTPEQSVTFEVGLRERAQPAEMHVMAKQLLKQSNRVAIG